MRMENRFWADFDDVIENFGSSLGEARAAERLTDTTFRFRGGRDRVVYAHSAILKHSFPLVKHLMEQVSCACPSTLCPHEVPRLDFILDGFQPEDVAGLLALVYQGHFESSLKRIKRVKALTKCFQMNPLLAHRPVTPQIDGRFGDKVSFVHSTASNRGYEAPLARSLSPIPEGELHYPLHDLNVPIELLSHLPDEFLNDSMPKESPRSLPVLNHGCQAESRSTPQIVNVFPTEMNKEDATGLVWPERHDIRVSMAAGRVEVGPGSNNNWSDVEPMLELAKNRICFICQQDFSGLPWCRLKDHVTFHFRREILALFPRSAKNCEVCQMTPNNMVRHLGNDHGALKKFIPTDLAILLFNRGRSGVKTMKHIRRIVGKDKMAKMSPKKLLNTVQGGQKVKEIKAPAAAFEQVFNPENMRIMLQACREKQNVCPLCHKLVGSIRSHLGTHFGRFIVNQPKLLQDRTCQVCGKKNKTNNAAALHIGFTHNEYQKMVVRGDVLKAPVFQCRKKPLAKTDPAESTSA